MTIEEFKNTDWREGMKVRCRPNNEHHSLSIGVVVMFNFDQRLIATLPPGDANDPFEWEWWRCENCELITEQSKKR